MLSRLLPITVVSFFAFASIAEPVVFTFDGDEDETVFLHTVDPSLPMLQLREDSSSNPIFELGQVSYSPLIVEVDAPSNGDIGVVYDVQVPSTVNFQSGEGTYSDPVGMMIDGSLPGWSDTHLRRCEFPECVAALPSAYGTGDAVDPCQDCRPHVSSFDFGDVRYIPFRWKPVGESDWMYGWVSFRILSDTQICITCKPGFPEYHLTRGTLDYVAIGMETEPNTPIWNGGYCRVDFNFDSEIDFFDIADFLNLYSGGNSRADINEDGVIDFFDISEFLRLYSGGCEL